jgi:hypothetical protein
MLSPGEMNPLLGGGWNKRLFSLDSSFKAKAGGPGLPTLLGSSLL